MHECQGWNFEASDAALLVCRNDHDKSACCNLQPMHPCEVLALVNELRAALIEAEARVAAERERLATLAETRSDGWHSLTAAEIRAGRVEA